MEKLVRDGINYLDKVNIRTASPDEMPRLLGRKLVEEANEVLRALMLHNSVITPFNRHIRLVEELADITEVEDVIIELNGIEGDSVDLAQTRKHEHLGGFDERRVLTLPDSHHVDSQLRSLVEDCILALASQIAFDERLQLIKSLTERAELLGCLGTVA